MKLKKLKARAQGGCGASENIYIYLKREVHSLHNYNQIQNKEDTTASTFVSLLLKTKHVSTYYRVIITRTILS
jgi:hypothetical protein